MCPLSIFCSRVTPPNPESINQVYPYDVRLVPSAIINGSFESAPLGNVSVQLVDYSGMKHTPTNTCITREGISCDTPEEIPLEKPRITREGWSRP